MYISKCTCTEKLWCFVAKCNLGKVNLELMVPAVLPSLHMICGDASLEFAGANLIQPCSLAIIAISTFVSESLRIHKPHPPFPGGYLTSEVSIGLGKYFHWTSFSVMAPVNGCYWGGSRLPGCHGDPCGTWITSDPSPLTFKAPVPTLISWRWV